MSRRTPFVLALPRASIDPWANWNGVELRSSRKRGGIEKKCKSLAPLCDRHQECKAAIASDSGSANPDATAAPSIIGTWHWTRKQNNCTEVYSFRNDGTVSVISGDEKTENECNIASAADSNRRFRLQLKTTKDLGGRDCANSTDDSTGQTSTVYVRFNSDASLHIVLPIPHQNGLLRTVKKGFAVRAE
jgi:hypothetical protein